MSLVHKRSGKSRQSLHLTGKVLACKQLDDFHRFKNEDDLLRSSGISPEETLKVLNTKREAYAYAEQNEGWVLQLRSLFGQLEEQPVALPAYVDSPYPRRNRAKPDEIIYPHVPARWYRQGKDILEMLDSPRLMHCDTDSLPPELKMLVKSAREVGLDKVNTGGNLNSWVQSNPKDEPKWLPDLLNQLMVELHHLLHTDEYKKKAYSRIRRFRENYKSCKKLIRSLRNQFRRLLVLRIDVSYLKEFCKHIPCEQFMNDLNRLFMNKRDNKIFKGWVGFIRKLEYGVSKGPHAHFLIFFDGSVRMPDAHAYIARQICDYWVKLTGGKGCAYNCNDALHRYQHVAVGCLHRDDDGMYHALNYVITYLCKDDQHNSAYFSAKAKMITRSHIELEGLTDKSGSSRRKKVSPS
jgi:hypothetical protein